MKQRSHYDWLFDNLNTFLNSLIGKDMDYRGMISAHGDKAYGYREIWADDGIPFEHGVAIYFLTYISPYSREVREIESGEWKPPGDWVKENYERFKPHLPPPETVV